MRDQHHRGAGRHEDLLHLLADEQRHLEVERRERLVDEEHPGLGRQRAHDRGGLLLAAGHAEDEQEQRDQRGRRRRAEEADQKLDAAAGLFVAAERRAISSSTPPTITAAAHHSQGVTTSPASATPSTIAMTGLTNV